MRGCQFFIRAGLADSFPLSADAGDLVINCGASQTVTTDAAYGAISIGQGGAAGNLTLNSGNIVANAGGSDIGVGNLGAGTLTCNGGTPTGNQIADADVGTGDVTQTSGSVTTDFLSLSVVGPSGTYSIGGRTLSISAGGQGLAVGTVRSGTLTVNGGAVSIAAANGLVIAQGAGASGTVNLDGGMITTTKVSTGGGTSTLNFNGATLRASSATTRFLQGLDTAQIRDGGAIVLSDASAITIAQSLTHSTLGGDSAIDGGLTVSGGGLVTLSGTNTYPGGTTLGSGLLLISRDANLGDAAGGLAFVGGISGGTLTATASFTSGRPVTLNASGSFTMNPGATLTLSGAISRAGYGIQKTGAGTLVLSGINTYTGDTNVFRGSLSFASDRSLGAAASSIVLTGGTLETTASFSSSRNIVVSSSGVVATAAGTTLTANGVISGTGLFVKTGAGVLALTATNTYSNTMTISGGTLQVGNGGTTGTLGTGNVINNSALAFNRSNSLTIANAISGTVTQGGSGAIVLTGTNSYAGTTTIAAGTLQVGDGGTTGTLGTGSVSNNAALAFNRSSTLTVANPSSGKGTVTQSGSGTTLLTGANSYTGNTTVNGGTHSVNGSIASSGSVVVNSGGTLGGTGTLSRTVINAGGTLAPGNSIGTLGTMGDVAFNTGSTYLVEVDRAEASDRLAVTGNVSINDGVTLAVRPLTARETGSNYADLTRYIVLTTTGTVTGRFATVTDSLPSLMPM